MKFRYPRRGNHRLELLVDGAAFFPAMLEAIGAARHSILLAMYMIHPGACAERWRAALAEAAERGVDVRILADGFGSHPAEALLDSLQTAGVHVGWFNPPRFWPPLVNLFRDHRKILVVDGRLGFIGGFCLSDEFDPEATDSPWHDVALRVEGPCVADMLAEFRRDWALYGSGKTYADIAAPPPDGEASCRLVRNHPLHLREIRRSAQRRIRTARRSVRLVTPYFAPPRRLRRALRAAARRGVDVTLLLSGPETDHQLVRYAGRRHYAGLLRAGVRIFEYEGFLHMKAVLADGWVSGGSCNLDHWNLRWNRDANLETEHGPTVSAYASLIEADIAASREITPSTLLGRSALERVQQWFASWFDVWIVRSAYRRQLWACRKQASLTRHRGTPR